MCLSVEDDDDFAFLATIPLTLISARFIDRIGVASYERTCVS